MNEYSTNLRKEDGEQVALVIRRLKYVDMFNPMPHHSVSSRNAALDFGSLFETQGLAYWGLNPLISAISASEISRVVLGTLLAAATNAKVRKRNLLLVIDEFQQMVAPGVLQLALRQARSLGVTVLLLNQTVDDLKTSKNNFVPTVEANTAIQLWLNAAGRDSIDQIQRLGGKYVDYLYGQSFDAQGVSRQSRQEVLVDRFDATTIAAASSARGQFIVRISNNDGYAQYNGIPLIARSDFHLQHREYLRRASAPWPSISISSSIVGQFSNANQVPTNSSQNQTSAPSKPPTIPQGVPVPFPSPRRVIARGSLGSGAP
jgi:hypothetical protein